MNIFDTSAEFFHGATNAVNEIFSSRHAEVDISVDALAKTVQGLGYLVPEDVAKHDNLGMTKADRDTEIEALNQAFMVPAAPEVDYAQAEEPEAALTTSPEPTTSALLVSDDEAIEMQRFQEEAYKMIEDARQKVDA